MTSLTIAEVEEDTIEDRLRRLQKSPEEIAHIIATTPVFDYDAWAAQGDPPTPESEAEQEEFLRVIYEARRRDAEATLRDERVFP